MFGKMRSLEKLLLTIMIKGAVHSEHAYEMN